MHAQHYLRLRDLRDCEQESSSDSDSERDTSSSYSTSSSEGEETRQQKCHKYFLQGRAHKPYRIAADISAVFERLEEGQSANLGCSS